MVVVHDASRGEFDPDETADRLLEAVRLGINDVNALVRTVREVVLGAMRIDPADVKRADRIAGYPDCREAFRLSRRGRTGACALRSRRLRK